MEGTRTLAGFHESFDDGVGILNHTWGYVDTSIPGQITLRGDAGAMQRPWGPEAGNGYGRYEVTASMSADAPGPAALLWPGDDRWPGSEYDIVEVINGTPYGVVHWKDGSGGWDNYESRFFDGVDETQVHTYGLEWREGHIDFFVDGQHRGTVDHNVGADYAHGGMNEVLSVMNSGGGTFLTVYDVSYSPFG
jgi:Glycosyl hydrolases family 16